MIGNNERGPFQLLQLFSVHMHLMVEQAEKNATAYFQDRVEQFRIVLDFNSVKISELRFLLKHGR